MTISLATRENNLDILFVPSCLVVTHEDCNYSDMMEWTSRQTVISKVYHPRLWWSILAVHGTGNIISFLGFILLLLSMASIIKSPIIIFSSILMLSIIPMEMANGLLLMPSIIKMMPENKGEIISTSHFYCLLAPLASLLALVNTIYSLFTIRITWRGITYEMRSKTETIVIDSKQAHH